MVMSPLSISRLAFIFVWISALTSPTFGGVRAKRVAAKALAITSNTGSISPVLTRTPEHYRMSLVRTSAAGIVIWKTFLYEGSYNRALETDVQDVLLAELRLEGKEVVA
jgi:hypothetical protein